MTKNVCSMTQHLSLVLATIVSSTLFGQYTSGKDQYVVQVDSTTVEGSSLLYREANDGSLFLMDLSIAVNSDSVTMFKNHHGTFIRVPKKMGKADFAKRIRNGKVSLFEPVKMRLYSDEALNIKENNGVSPQEKGLATGQKFKYYAVAGENPREAIVKNMRIDFVENQESWNYLKRYRKNQWLQGSLVGGGAGIFTYSMMNASGGQGFNPLSLVGLVVAASSFLLEPAKDDLKWMAVESYNKLP